MVDESMKVVDSNEVEDENARVVAYRIQREHTKRKRRGE
jgi:hypothetical protein